MATTMMLFVSLVLITVTTCSVQVPRARATIYRSVPGGNPTTALGVLNLVERNGVVSISGNLTGLPPGPHGFHVHQYGDMGNGCLAAGDHFNPLRSNHGGPANPPSARHVGDLGNINTLLNGATSINIQDSLITFTGIRGIVGRAFAIHANIDDLGTAGNVGSRTTGNAGARLACGVIGYVMPASG